LVTGAFVEALLAEGSLELAGAFVDEGFHALRGCKVPVRLFSLKKIQRLPSDRSIVVSSRPADEAGKMDR